VEPLIIASLGFGLVLVLIVIGFPIAIALGLVGVLGCFIAQGSANILAMTPFKALDSFVLTAVPLFIFMGQVFVVSGASEMVYRGASKVLSWAPGGLLHSNIGASALFAAILIVVAIAVMIPDSLVDTSFANHWIEGRSPREFLLFGGEISPMYYVVAVLCFVLCGCNEFLVEFILRVARGSIR